jgi:formylglycine-generating enzyme required for sulfatase activity
MIKIDKALCQPFNFQVGTLVKSGQTWQVQKSDGRACRYVEQLDENTTLDLVAIGGGEFLMGSPDDEPNNQPDEKPQHLVTVPDFYLGRYPVTQAQWRSIAAMPAVDHELHLDPSEFKGVNRPVEQVSWFDAIAKRCLGRSSFVRG